VRLRVDRRRETSPSCQSGLNCASENRELTAALATEHRAGGLGSLERRYMQVLACTEEAAERWESRRKAEPNPPGSIRIVFIRRRSSATVLGLPFPGIGEAIQMFGVRFFSHDYDRLTRPSRRRIIGVRQLQTRQFSVVWTNNLNADGQTLVIKARWGSQSGTSRHCYR
jgi:hypothetical protein